MRCQMSKKQEIQQIDPESWKTDVPAQKLFDAANCLSRCRKVLDYGCGDAWGSIIIAKGGCQDVTAVALPEIGNKSCGSILRGKIFRVAMLHPKITQNFIFYRKGVFSRA